MTQLCIGCYVNDVIRKARFIISGTGYCAACAKTVWPLVADAQIQKSVNGIRRARS